MSVSTLVVGVLCLIVIVLVYILWTNPVDSIPASVMTSLSKKKELPEVVAFLLDELSQARNSSEYSVALEQLRIVMDNTYISDDELIKLKLNLA